MSTYDILDLDSTSPSTLEEDKILNLSNMYRKLIFQNYLEPEESGTNYSKLTKDYLSWMCDELVNFKDVAKSYYWLGYIQGVLTMDGCLIVEEI